MSANESPTVQNLTQPHAPEHCKRAERLILLIRALQLLSSGLNLASQQLQNGGLKPSNTVKSGENINGISSEAYAKCLLTITFSVVYDELEIPNNLERVEEVERKWTSSKGNSQSHNS